METKQISSRLALVIVIGALTFTSCRKKNEVINEPEATDTEQTTAGDNSLSESIAGDIESMGSEASENEKSFNYRGGNDVSFTDALSIAPCATVTLANQLITVDFGASGCMGADGRIRTGKLIYNFSASAQGATFYRNPGFNMNVTSQNYVVDGYSVTINNKTVSNTTPANITASTNLTWSVSANISIVKPNNGGTISWICNRTKELTNTSDSTCYMGQSTYIRWNKAIVMINGSASGINANAETYTSVANNLIRNFQCSPDVLRPHRHPLIGGTVTYTPGNRYPRIVNYGNGTSCDFNATITINNVTYNVILP